MLALGQTFHSDGSWRKCHTTERQVIHETASVTKQACIHRSHGKLCATEHPGTRKRCHRRPRRPNTASKEAVHQDYGKYLDLTKCTAHLGIRVAKALPQGVRAMPCSTKLWISCATSKPYGVICQHRPSCPSTSENARRANPTGPCRVIGRMTYGLVNMINSAGPG